MKALFIGRFQPFHKGHLKIIQKISKEFDEIVIGIGSSQYNHTLENPFTSEERKKMIKDTLENESIKNFKIIFIPDINNPPKWVEHVKSIIPDFDVVITNSAFTKRLFTEKGFAVRGTPSYKRELYTGKKIRDKIIKNERWDNLVPDEVFNFIKKIKGDKRLIK